MNSSSLNTSMMSSLSGQSSLKKKGKEDAKNYLQTWNVFYKEFDEDRFNKAMMMPWFSRASVQVSPQGIDRRFVGVFFSWVERYFLNLQTRNIVAICNSISVVGTSDEHAVSMGKQDLMKMVSAFNSISMADFSFSRFTALHEELHRFIGWGQQAGHEHEHEQQSAQNFSLLAKAFFTKKYQEAQSNAARSGGEWHYASIQSFFEKFDKDKALLLSTWMKMPIKVFVAKTEKIQILCDKNGGAKENMTKIDKQILIVEDFATGAVHIGYDCSAERLFRFFMQAGVVAEGESNTHSMIKRSDQLELVNSSLTKRVTSDCSVACESAMAFTSAAEKDLSEMKKIFNQMSASWLKTIGMVKNYIVPAVGIISEKKDTFLRALDAQASILEQVSLQFGTPQDRSRIEEIHEKYIVKHSAILKGAVEVDPLKIKKDPKVAVEKVQVIKSSKLLADQAAAATASQAKSGLMLHKGGKTIEQLIYSDSEDTSQWTMKKVLDEARHGITLVECAICCDQKKSSEFWHAKCQHVYCFDCLKEHIQSRVDEGKRLFCDLTCCMCTLPLEPKELYAFLSPKIQAQIDDFYANMILNFTCPNEKCGTSSNISSKTIALSDGFITNCCAQHVCSKCKGKFHGNSLCPKQTKDLIESVSVFRDAQTTDAARMFRFCPVCAQLAFKDEGCNHVRCTKCSTEFCFQCSAPRHSILGHGNHYHRKGCPDFAEFIDKKSKKPVDLEFDVKKCTVCAKIRQPCKRPIEWNDFNQTLIDRIGIDVFNNFPDNFIL